MGNEWKILESDFFVGSGSSRELDWKSHLAALLALEKSLAASRKALVALDLAAIQRETQEQFALLEELRAIQRRLERQPRSEIRNQPESGKERETRGHDGSEAAMVREVRRTASRILNATRLQAALLVRLQAKLRVLANALAGPASTYDPASVRQPAWRIESPGNRISPCQV